MLYLKQSHIVPRFNQLVAQFVPIPKLFLLPVSIKRYPISVTTFTTAYLLFVALARHQYK